MRTRSVVAGLAAIVAALLLAGAAYAIVVERVDVDLLCDDAGQTMAYVFTRDEPRASLDWPWLRVFC